MPLAAMAMAVASTMARASSVRPLGGTGSWVPGSTAEEEEEGEEEGIAGAGLRGRAGPAPAKYSMAQLALRAQRRQKEDPWQAADAWWGAKVADMKMQQAGAAADEEAGAEWGLEEAGDSLLPLPSLQVGETHASVPQPGASNSAQAGGGLGATGQGTTGRQERPEQQQQQPEHQSPFASFRLGSDELGLPAQDQRSSSGSRVAMGVPVLEEGDGEGVRGLRHGNGAAEVGAAEAGGSSNMAVAPSSSPHGAPPEHDAPLSGHVSWAQGAPGTTADSAPAAASLVERSSGSVSSSVAVGRGAAGASGASGTAGASGTSGTGGASGTAGASDTSGTGGTVLGKPPLPTQRSSSMHPLGLVPLALGLRPSHTARTRQGSSRMGGSPEWGAPAVAGGGLMRQGSAASVTSPPQHSMSVTAHGAGLQGSVPSRPSLLSQQFPQGAHLQPEAGSQLGERFSGSAVMAAGQLPPGFLKKRPYLSISRVLGKGLNIAVNSVALERGEWTSHGWAAAGGQEPGVYIPPSLPQIDPDDLTKVWFCWGRGRGGFG